MPETTNNKTKIFAKTAMGAGIFGGVTAALCVACWGIGQAMGADIFAVDAFDVDILMYTVIAIATVIGGAMNGLQAVKQISTTMVSMSTTEPCDEESESYLTKQHAPLSYRHVPNYDSPISNSSRAINDGDAVEEAPKSFKSFCCC